MAQHNELGDKGERLAERYLKEQGYTIVERDWHLDNRDIDLIALTNDCRQIVFVEVKTRRTDDINDPLAAVTVAKMRSIATCANAYLKTCDTDAEPRFDVITIVGQGTDNAKIQHIENAFNPCML